MTPADLATLCARVATSQRKAAFAIGISERQMRRYLAGAAIPLAIVLALERVADQRSRQSGGESA